MEGFGAPGAAVTDDRPGNGGGGFLNVQCKCVNDFNRPSNVPLHSLGMVSEVLIRKYPNRRLYDARTHRFIKLSYVASLIKSGYSVSVSDYRTGEDVTRSVLSQIVIQEAKGRVGPLTIDFLRQLIRLQGSSLDSLVPFYFDQLAAQLRTITPMWTTDIQANETDRPLDMGSAASVNAREMTSYPWRHPSEEDGH